MKTPLDILLCEDQEADAALILRHLEKAGYDVRYQRAETAAEMTGALDTGHWDIILSDYNIPGFGGPEALAILRSTGKDIPFVLISGTIGEETAVSIMKAGAGDYLMKDNLMRLPEVVKREMEEAENRRQMKAAAERIRADEEKYRAMISHSLFAIFLASPGGKIEEANLAACDLFGYTEGELLQLSREQLLDFTDPALIGKLYQRDTRGSASGEFIGIRKNGERFHCEVSSIIFKDIHGRAMSCSMLANISERKQAELEINERNEELKRLSGHLQSVREDERKYIAREIHDVLGQLATAIKINLDWLNLRLPSVEETIKSRIVYTISITENMIESTRKIATSLRPSVIDDLSLMEALRWQCQEFERSSGLLCRVEGTIDDAGIPVHIRTELFRIVQESLTNVIRHAQATEACLEVKEAGGIVHLMITDNGRGFNGDARTTHLGLVGLRERAMAIQGELMISSEPGKGTRVHLTIPRGRLLAS